MSNSGPLELGTGLMSSCTSGFGGFLVVDRQASCVQLWAIGAGDWLDE